MAIKDLMAYAGMKFPITGAPTQEQVSTAVDSYLERHPVTPGASEAEAAQIEQNTEEIERLDSEMVKTINGKSPDEDGNVEVDAGGVKTVNGVAPDANGNVVVAVSGGTDSGGNVDQVSVEPAKKDIPRVFFGSQLQQTKDEAVTTFSYRSETLSFDCYAEIKAQGNSSMSYLKKNQTVKLFKDADCTEKMKVDFKGWGKQNKFCFKANWIDLTHARNIVSARLWADVVKSRANYEDIPELLRTSPNQGAVDGFPVKVYAGGVYQGRYTVNIPKDKWTFNMDDELDEHCVLCGENYVSGCFRAAAQINESDWTDEIHDTVPASIKTRWNQVISFVMNSTDDEFRANLSQYFYVDSLIDYYLFGLASCGLDALGKNQIYATYDGQRWIACMYDMDSTWGLYWNGSKFVSTSYGRDEYEDYVHTDGNLLYNRLEQLFWSELQTRWAELKNGALSIENIINRFERFTDIAPAELVKEDYASTTGGGKFTGIPSQTTNNIQQIRAFALARQAWTDTYVAGLTPEDEVPCTGISMNINTLTFTAEGTQTLTATVTPDGCTDEILWDSDNTSIATVSGGVVTAVANGNATITAKCGEYSASCSVAVSGIAEPVACTGITLDKTELTFTEEGSQTIVATVTPADTTDTIVWSSDNESVATVENGVVTAIGNGSANITVTCGSQSANCAVSVSGIVELTRIQTTTTTRSGVLYNHKGEEEVNSTFSASEEYLDIEGFKYVTAYGSSVQLYFAFYDSEKTPISYETISISNPGYKPANHLFIIPDSAKYCRVSKTSATAEVITVKAYKEDLWVKTDVVWSDTAEYAVNSGTVATGNNYITPDAITMPDGVLGVKLEKVNSSKFTYLGCATYDASMTFKKYTENPNASEMIELGIASNSIGAVRLSAFPNAETDIPSTGLAVKFFYK